jgi:hypothetical protein
VGEKATVLRYIADPPPKRDRIESGRVHPVYQNPALIRIHQSIEAAKKRGFAGSAFSDQRHTLGLPHADRHLIECHNRPVALRYTLRPEHDIA